jgi:hypothetical protein
MRQAVNYGQEELLSEEFQYSAGMQLPALSFTCSKLLFVVLCI